MTAFDIAKRAVIRVGGGRGFIASAGDERWIITAAHCLPFDRLPSPHLSNSVGELTLPKIAGRIAAKRLTIWGHLSAYSLTDDFAVFAAPDNQELTREYERFEHFTATGLVIGTSPSKVESYKWMDVAGVAAWVLSLGGEWQACKLHNGGRFLTLDDSATIDGGMSGSPIINESGAAIGVISTGSGGYGSNLNPSLSDCLSPWLLRKLDVVQAHALATRTMVKQMNDEEDFDNNPPLLIELLVENIAIYARGVLDDEHVRPMAEQLLRSFEAIEGRPADDYMEIENWSKSHLDIKAARFLVLRGGKL